MESALPLTKQRHGFSKLLRSPSKLALIVLNLVVYYLLIKWFTGNIKLDRLADHLGQIPAWALLCSLCINLMALVLYGVRMALLLRSKFHTAFSIINIGYALNTLVPLRLGEAMKMYLGHKLYGIPLTGIFAASVAEKLADLFKLLLLAAVVVAFAASALVQSNVLLPVGILVLLGVLFFILFRIYIARIVKLLPKRGRLRRISIELHKHAKSYQVGRILIISVGIWVLNVALVFFTFNTYLPILHISILDAVTLLLIISFAIAIPSAPAGVGLFEAGIVVYLTQKSGISNEAALAAATAFHLIITLPQLTITGWLLWSRARLIKVSV